MPSAVATDLDVNVRIKIQSRQSAMPIAICTILSLAVREMINCPGNVANASRHGVLKRPGPSQIVILTGRIEHTPSHQSFVPTIHGSHHLAVTTADDRRVIKAVVLKKASVCRPSKSLLIHRRRLLIGAEFQ